MKIPRDSLATERGAYVQLKQIYEERLTNINLRIKMIDVEMKKNKGEEKSEQQPIPTSN